ncbi:MAG: hypothetical protein ACYCT2_04770 [Thermoplasmataceae archaeon]
MTGMTAMFLGIPPITVPPYLNPLNWWHSAETFTVSNVEKIIEYFIYLIIGTVLDVFQSVIGYAIGVFFSFSQDTYSSLLFLGPFSAPVFMVIFAAVGSAMYLVFRAAEGLA